jgi:hypothetical protein
VNRKFIQVSIAVLFLITACGQVTGPVTPLATGVFPQNQQGISASTLVLVPSKTPREPRNEPTSTPTAPPNLTPTFDIKNIVTATLAPTAACPEITGNIPINLPGKKEYIPDGKELENEYINPILNYLNGGGDPEELLEKLKTQYGSGEYEMGSRLDVTNDKTNEIIIEYPAFVIYTCRHRQYVIAYQKGAAFASYKILDDLNQNGIPEIFVYSFISNAGIDVEIDEWSGSEFATIGNLGIDGGTQYDIRDENGDGLKEFIFRGGAPGICCEADLNPWRYKSRIYAWNGNSYEEIYEFFDVPQYRFQAIQDADREMVYGNEEIALNLYQGVIFADNLDWWSPEKKYYLDNAINHRFEQPTPTLAPAPTIDSSEYPRLAAYAYYRIMLLHIVQGHESDAGTVYKTLQQKFSNDPFGKPYVEMATVFWDNYQSTHKMYDGCAAAIQYAAEHSEILKPLGSDYHGSQSHAYIPADVCPFR